MASTAVHYPVDKDQPHIPFWADNEELGIAGENFFDQFVTFDAGDAAALSGEVLEDPPSPSLLLDSFQNEISNSFPHQLDWPLGTSGPEVADTTPLQDLSIASESNPAAAAADSYPAAVLTALAGDPVLSGGSISDSELLRLEGISLKSPRENVTEPCSPKFATPAPPSPRKHSRFVESLYATIRRATHRSKSPKKQSRQSANMARSDVFLGDPRSTLDILDMKYDEAGLGVKPEPMTCDGLPLSPPLTGRITNERQAAAATASGFVSGHLDDPFCENMLGAPAMIHPAERRMSTPDSTPVISGDTFFPNGIMVPVNPNMGSYRHPQRVHHRSTNSAEWPMEGLLTSPKFNTDDAANMWDTGSNSNIAGPTWWDVAKNELSAHAEARSNNLHGNAAHNIAMHNQQADLEYQYNTDLSGLMIHMPRPRGPPASVLMGEHGLVNAAISSSSYPLPPNTTPHAHHHYTTNTGKHGYTERRARPRAPSSGARHHHGLQTSPRKLHHSHSLGYLREQSTSPSPISRHAPQFSHPHPHPHHTNHQERRQQRSSSLTMRKQRSFTRREPRTPGGGSTTPGSIGGGGGFVDFVNYTPNDGNALMTGVAPSGSSKTKARREKEAMERSRRISEAAMKAVQEIGGDVKKFMGDLSLELE